MSDVGYERTSTGKPVLEAYDPFMSGLVQQPEADWPNIRSDGKRGCLARRADGHYCQKRPESGQTVCNVHGGSTPASKAAVAARFAALVDPAISTLADVMEHGVDDAHRVRAATAILDRAGYQPTTKVEIADAQSELLSLLLALDSPGTDLGEIEAESWDDDEPTEV